jgi:hypothetical protein
LDHFAGAGQWLCDICPKIRRMMIDPAVFQSFSHASLALRPICRRGFAVACVPKVAKIQKMA